MTDYRALAARRKACALGGQPYATVARRLRAAAKRLMAWRRVDREHAYARIHWANLDARTYCK